MRKKIVTMLIGFLIVGGLCALEHHAVKHHTSEALEEAAQMLDALRAGDLQTGMRMAREMDGTWDEWAQGLELMIDHGSTDEVRFALSRLIAALEGEDQASALIYASEPEGCIEHLCDRQAVSLQNLL